MKIIEWERIEETGNGGLYRTKTPTGWLITNYHGEHYTFVPDPEHLWLKEEE